MTPKPGSLGAYVLAARLRTLPVGLSPVLVGCGVAAHAGGFRLLPSVLALLGALLLQIVSNLANDWFDHAKGADGADRIGPPRAAQLGLLTGAQLRNAILAVAGIALLDGIALTAIAGWPIVAIGVASLISAVLYTGGPRPLGWIGLGDVFVFMFFGPVAVAGTTFVNTLGWDPLALLLSAPIGLLAAAVLMVNNVRDLEADARVGKRTAAVRLGRERAVTAYAAELAIPYVIVGALAAAQRLPWVSLAVLLTAPVAGLLYRTVSGSRDGPTLNGALAGTAKLLLRFAILLLSALALPGLP